MREMDVICLSSDESNDEVEIVSCSEFTKSELLPLSEVRVDVEAVNVSIPQRYIDLTDPRWAFPELKLRKKLDCPSPPVIDLTECEDKETETKPPRDRRLEKGSAHKNAVSNDREFILLESSPRDAESPQQDCGRRTPPAQRHLSCPARGAQGDGATADPCRDAPAVKSTVKLPFLKARVSELNTSGASVQVSNGFSQTSLCHGQLNDNGEAPDCTSNLKTASLNMDPSLSECPPEGMKPPSGHEINSKELSKEQLQVKGSQHLQRPADPPGSEEGRPDANLNTDNTWENKLDGFHSTTHVPSPTFTSSPQAKAPKEPLASNAEQMDLDQYESGQSCSSARSSSRSPTSGVNSREEFDSDSASSHSHTSPGNRSPASQHMLGETTPEWQLETRAYDDNLGSESPETLPLHGESDGEDMSQESRFGSDFRAVSREDRQYVCPDALGKVMTEPTRVLLDEDYDLFGAPEVLCHQSLSLVYSTIDENYPEGTLQLLSDLLQPGYYPPKDITSHLLRGILLDPQSPYHLSVQAFNLLIWTQRHHRVNKNTVPWDWELLTSVMSNQDCTKQLGCEVVRMLLEYVVQTLEDDFRAKCSMGVLHHSIAKATLSCDRQFPRVRDVIRWLFSAIKNSIELGKRKETIKERDEQLRIVSLFQRMLSLALEVDRCPALNSAKLSQELFHMVLSHMPPRAHRRLLLESLQSKLLLCKLVEQLLDYACPQKISVPMSLSLLLHFLKHCTLAPDPTATWAAPPPSSEAKPPRWCTSPRTW
uniref:SUMO interacting motifs containing 1 n=1 Tax=Kryptolebias marmoratus TaxID=37003 RepID=A0A3Q2ZQU0_KRYMA